MSSKWPPGSPCLCLVLQHGHHDVVRTRFILVEMTWNKRNEIHYTILRQWSVFCVVQWYQEGFSIVLSIEFNRLCIVLGLSCIVEAFLMLLRVSDTRLSRWRLIKVFVVFMLVSPTSLANMVAVSLFCYPTWRHMRKLVWIPNWKDKGAKLMKQSQDKKSAPYKQ